MSYTEQELEYSMSSEIEATTEWKRFCTFTKESELQKGLIPVWLDFFWKVPDKDEQVYFIKDDYQRMGYTRNLEPYVSIIYVMGTGNKLFFEEPTDRYHEYYMKDLVELEYVHPFLLFINKKMVPWDIFKLIKCDQFFTIYIDRDRDIPITDVRILSLPTNVVYTEEMNKTWNNIMFSFNKNGEYDKNGPITISTSNEYMIPIEIHDDDGYNNYDYDLDLYKNLNLENFIMFESDGSLRLNDSTKDTIENMNIFTIDYGKANPRYIVVFYSEYSNANESIVYRARNKSYIKELIRGTKISDISLSEVKRKFDFAHDVFTEYDTNLQNSENYVFFEDENKYDNVFEKVKPINIMTWGKYPELESDYNSLYNYSNIDIDANMYLEFHSYQEYVLNDSSSVTMTSYTPINGEAILVFFNSTYIEPSRYTLSGNTITMVDPINDPILNNVIVTLYVITNNTALSPSSTNDIQINTEIVSSTYADQPIIYFSSQYQKHYDSLLVFRGSVFMSPSRYYVKNKRKIIFYNKSDYMNKADDLLLIFVTNKNDFTSISSTVPTHVRMGCIKETIETTSNTYKIKSINPKKVLDGNSAIVFLNSTFLDPSRYVFKYNMISLTDPTDYFIAGKSLDIVFGYKCFDPKGSSPTGETGLFEGNPSSITVPRDLSTGSNKQTFQLIFFDGYCNPKANDSVEYTPSTITFDVTELENRLEIVYLKNCINGKWDVTADSFGNIDVTNSWIPKNEITILSDLNDTAGNLYPIQSTLSGNTLTIDTKYVGTKLYMCSRYQFMHMQFTMSNNVITLPYMPFDTAYDKDKFMVFYDGKYLNCADYVVLLPTEETMNDVRAPRIFFSFKEDIERLIDVYYVSSIPFGLAQNINREFILYTIKVPITSVNQDKVLVPYPFKGYPHIYDAFYCIKDTVYIDKDRYTISGDYIVFNDPVEFAAWVGQDIIFVFPYYVTDGDDIGSTEFGKKLDASLYLDFKQYQEITGPNNSTSVTFSSYTLRTGNEAVMLFFNSTYIDPSRYTLSGNTVTMLDPINDYISGSTIVTLVVETNNTTSSPTIPNDIRLDAVLVNPTVANQSVFDIPSSDLDYYDSMMIFKGSTLFSPGRYVLTSNKIYIINSSDYLTSKESLLFVFLKDKNDVAPRTFNNLHTKMIYTYGRIQTKTKSYTFVKDPNIKKTFTKDSLIIFLNSTYLDPSRYILSGNTITLLGTNDYFYAGKSIIIAYAYREYYNKYTLPPTGGNTPDYDPKDIIYFTEKSVMSNKYDHTYTIPFVNLPYTSTEFFVTYGSKFIPAAHYIVDRDAQTITFLEPDASNLVDGRAIKFTFVHNYEYTHIAKSEISVDVIIGMKEIDIPYPPCPIRRYTDLLKLKFFIYYGEIFIDRDRYYVDNVNRKVIFTDDFEIDTDKHQLTFVFFYPGNITSSGTVAWLPESGYVYLNHTYVDRNFNNKMCLMFVNGMLVDVDDVLPISNSLFKVSKNIFQRYDFNFINCAPLITEFKNKYSEKMDNWSTLIDPLPIE